MVDKNPYEKDEEVNVPDFGDSEDKGTDPIFNMDTTGLSSETDSYSVEEEAESSSKTAIIVLIVFLVLFLVGAVSGWIFGISKSNEVSTITEEYTAYKEKTQKQITDLETQVSTLQAKVTELESNTSSNSTEGGSTSSGTGTKTEANTYYSMKADVKVRTGAGTSYEIANYDKLPNEIKDIVLYDAASKTITTKAAKFPIYETKEDSSKNLWGRIADNAWVCLKYQGEDWGTKQ